MSLEPLQAQMNGTTSTPILSTVTKSGHNPTTAPGPGQQEGDYNTITHDRNQPLSPARRAEVSPNPYNIPGSYGGAKPAETPGFEGDGTDTTPDTYFILEVSGEAKDTPQREDDYSSLSHDKKNPASPSRGRETTANPYNLPESYSMAKPLETPASPGKTRDPAPDTYFILEPDPAQRKTLDAAPPDGDYSTLNHDRNPRTPVTNGNDTSDNTYNLPESYNGAKPVETPQPSGDETDSTPDTYFVLEPDSTAGGGKNASPETYFILEAGPDAGEQREESYSLAKPILQGKEVVVSVGEEPAEAAEDYNTIDHTRRQPTSPSNGGETTANPYNIPDSYGNDSPVGTPASPRQERSSIDQNEDQLNSPSRTSEDYFLVEPDTTPCAAVSDTNDYSTISFDEAHNRSERPDHGGSAPNAYDNVRKNQDEEYSVTWNGERSTVINSDYDHIKH